MGNLSKKDQETLESKQTLVELINVLVKNYEEPQKYAQYKNLNPNDSTFEGLGTVLNRLLHSELGLYIDEVRTGSSESLPKQDMTLSEFLNSDKVTAKKVNGEWEVSVVLPTGENLTLHSPESKTEYEAKEIAYDYLKQEIAATNIKREIEQAMYSYPELLSFGNYLLSKKRRDMIKDNPLFSNEDFLQRYQKVSEADVLNWKEENK